MYTRRRIHYPHFSPWFLSLGGLGRHGQDQSGSIDPEESGALVGSNWGGYLALLKMVIYSGFSIKNGDFP